MGSLDEERGEGGSGSGRNQPSNTKTNGGPCKACLDIAKWLPVVFIVSVISWSYYAFAIQLCLLTMSEIWLKILTLILYHIVLVLFLWSYWRTIFSQSARVPRKFRIPPSELDRVESAQSEQEVNSILGSIVSGNQLPIQTRTNISQIRYCEKCSIIKPDRCHHCSVCGRCILKMDHHCPWVNNCVCFDNYKFFVLFLVYAFLYCFVIFLFSLPYFIKFWTRDGNGGGGGSEKFHVLFVFFVAAMFAVSLVSLFGYHCYLITKNRSTLESFRSPIFPDGPDTAGFSLGTYQNFIEIFGQDKRTWFLPIFTSLGDGISFPTSRETRPAGNYNSIHTTDVSGTTPPPDYDRCIGVRVDPASPNPSHPQTRPSQGNGDAILNQGNGNRSPPGQHPHQSRENESPLVLF